jgi:hypothetical protein
MGWLQAAFRTGTDRKHCESDLPTQTIDVIKEDPDDNRILECAVTAGSDVIVTYDKDLLRLGEHMGIKIERWISCNFEWRDSRVRCHRTLWFKYLTYPRAAC